MATIAFKDILPRLPNYIRAFGWLVGIRLLLAMHRANVKQCDHVRAWKIPGYQAVIHLRDTVSDHATFFQCIVRNQYAFNSFPQGRELQQSYEIEVSRGRQPLIIDCGGNIGLSTVWYAQQMPLARIVVVEPDLNNFNLLKRNVAIYGKRVTVIHGGVWDRPANLQILNPESGSAAFRVAELLTDSQIGLRAYSIDELCVLGGGGDPFIVKLDIEGAQAQVFRSNTDWTKRTRLIALELDDWLMPWKGTSRPFFLELANQPFDYLIAGEAIFCFRDPSSKD